MVRSTVNMTSARFASWFILLFVIMWSGQVNAQTQCPTSEEMENEPVSCNRLEIQDSGDADIDGVYNRVSHTCEGHCPKWVYRKGDRNLFRHPVDGQLRVSLDPCSPSPDGAPLIRQYAWRDPFRPQPEVSVECVDYKAHLEISPNSERGQFVMSRARQAAYSVHSYQVDLSPSAETLKLDIDSNCDGGGQVIEFSTDDEVVLCDPCQPDDCNSLVESRTLESNATFSLFMNTTRGQGNERLSVSYTVQYETDTMSPDIPSNTAVTDESLTLDQTTDSSATESSTTLTTPEQTEAVDDSSNFAEDEEDMRATFPAESTTAPSEDEDVTGFMDSEDEDVDTTDIPEYEYEYSMSTTEENLVAEPNTTDDMQEPDESPSDESNTTYTTQDPEESLLDESNTTDTTQAPDDSLSDESNTTDTTQVPDESLSDESNTTDTAQDPDESLSDESNTTDTTQEPDESLLDESNTTDATQDPDESPSDESNITIITQSPNESFWEDTNRTDTSQEPDDIDWEDGSATDIPEEDRETTGLDETTVAQSEARTSEMTSKRSQVTTESTTVVAADDTTEASRTTEDGDEEPSIIIVTTIIANNMTTLEAPPPSSTTTTAATPSTSTDMTTPVTSMTTRQEVTSVMTSTSDDDDADAPIQGPDVSDQSTPVDSKGSPATTEMTSSTRAATTPIAVTRIAREDTTPPPRVPSTTQATPQITTSRQAIPETTVSTTVTSEVATSPKVTTRAAVPVTTTTSTTATTTTSPPATTKARTTTQAMTTAAAVKTSRQASSTNPVPTTTSATTAEDACLSVNCPGYSVCQHGDCVCPQSCPVPGDQQRTVCAGGRRYATRCHAELALCQAGDNFEILDGECEEKEGMPAEQQESDPATEYLILYIIIAVLACAVLVLLILIIVLKARRRRRHLYYDVSRAESGKSASSNSGRNSSSKPKSPSVKSSSSSTRDPPKSRVTVEPVVKPKASRTLSAGSENFRASPMTKRGGSPIDSEEKPATKSAKKAADSQSISGCIVPFEPDEPVAGINNAGVSTFMLKDPPVKGDKAGLLTNDVSPATEVDQRAPSPRSGDTDSGILENGTGPSHDAPGEHVVRRENAPDRKSRSNENSVLEVRPQSIVVDLPPGGNAAGVCADDFETKF